MAAFERMGGFHVLKHEEPVEYMSVRYVMSVWILLLGVTSAAKIVFGALMVPEARRRKTPALWMVEALMLVLGVLQTLYRRSTVLHPAAYHVPQFLYEAHLFTEMELVFLFNIVLSVVSMPIPFFMVVMPLYITGIATCALHYLVAAPEAYHWEANLLIKAQLAVCGLLILASSGLQMQGLYKPKGGKKRR